VVAPSTGHCLPRLREFSLNCSSALPYNKSRSRFQIEDFRLSILRIRIRDGTLSQSDIA
jgi:hypothetical protein